MQTRLLVKMCKSYGLLTRNQCLSNTFVNLFFGWISRLTTGKCLDQQIKLGFTGIEDVAETAF